MHDAAFKVLAQGLDDVHQFLLDSIVPSNLPELCLVQAVKSLLKVYEHHVNIAIPSM